MPDKFFDEIKNELQNGAKVKGHPFRFFTLATSGVDNYARLRTMVLRKVTKGLKLTFFTDKRSKKVIHIKENKRISLLFYHPEKLLQIRVEGIATINTDPKRLKKMWDELGPESKKSYTTKEAPGSVIDNPVTLGYLKDGDHSCIVDVRPFRIEYLKLERPNHIRIRFFRDGKNWKSEFLVP